MRFHKGLRVDTNVQRTIDDPCRVNPSRRSTLRTGTLWSLLGHSGEVVTGELELQNQKWRVLFQGGERLC